MLMFMMIVAVVFFIYWDKDKDFDSGCEDVDYGDDDIGDGYGFVTDYDAGDNCFRL